MAIVKDWFAVPSKGTGVGADAIEPDFQGVPVLHSMCPYNQSGTFVCLIAIDSADETALTHKPGTTFIGRYGDPTLQTKLNQLTDSRGIARIDLTQYNIDV